MKLQRIKKMMNLKSEYYWTSGSFYSQSFMSSNIAWDARNKGLLVWEKMDKIKK